MKRAPMRRLLAAPLLVLSGAISGPSSPHAFAQVAPSVQLSLVSQSAWNGVGRPLHISFQATNASLTALDDLSVELIVGAPTTSRSLYELSLTQDSVPLIASPFPQKGTLAPGETRVFRVEQPVDELSPRGDSGLFPLKVELRSRDIAVGTLRTLMIFLIERPKVPLNLAWTWVLSEPVQHRPDGTFLAGTLESDIAPGGRLAEMAAALDGLGSRQVDVVVSSVLVDQLERMAQGYRILDAAGTVRTVPGGQAGAADAAALLRTLRTVAGRQGAELMATPLRTRVCRPCSEGAWEPSFRRSSTGDEHSWERRLAEPPPLTWPGLTGRSSTRRPSPSSGGREPGPSCWTPASSLPGSSNRLPCSAW